MAGSEYKVSEIEKMESEIGPLVAQYKRSIDSSTRLDPKSQKRLIDISRKLSDYYTNHKIWKRVDDYIESLRHVDPFRMAAHRCSVHLRALYARQPSLFS